MTIYDSHPMGHGAQTKTLYECSDCGDVQEILCKSEACFQKRKADKLKRLLEEAIEHWSSCCVRENPRSAEIRKEMEAL